MEFNGQPLFGAGDLEADNDQGVGDGIPDCLELAGWDAGGEIWTSSTALIDTDGDGLADGEELTVRTVTELANATGLFTPNVFAAFLTQFSNGVTYTPDTLVAQPYSNPRRTDTDDDIPIIDPASGEEFVLSDFDERNIGSDPRLRDTDGDGENDPLEAIGATDPTDPDQGPATNVDACLRSGGNLFIALDSLTLDGRTYSGCQRMAPSCVDQLAGDWLAADFGEVECLISAPFNDDTSLLPGFADVTAAVEALPQNGDLSTELAIACTSGGVCGALVAEISVAGGVSQGWGTVPLAGSKILQPKGPLIRVAVGGGAFSFIFLVVVASPFLQEESYDSARNEVLDDVAQAIRATDLARGLDPASSDEYDTRARSCVSADLPWQDLAEEAGLQSPENIDSQGFRTVAQVIPGTLSLVQFILSHVCLEIPIWMPGEISTTGRPLTQTTQHQREALGLWPTPPQVIGPVGNGLVQRPWAASQAAQLPRPIWAFMSRSPGRIDGWYNNKPECSGRVRGSGTVCDEFPLNTTVQGKAAVASDNPYPSIKFVNGLGVSHEGNAQFFETNDFYSRCRIPRAGGSFLLIPQPPGGATPPAAESFFICD